MRGERRYDRDEYGEPRRGSGGGKNAPLLLIGCGIAALVVVAVGGAAAWYFLADRGETQGAVIERYRAKHGEVPSVEALVPAWLSELPRDPVSGDPLEYEKLSRGYRIVSGAATDRKTEGGTKKNEAEVAFTVLR